MKDNNRILKGDDINRIHSGKQSKLNIEYLNNQNEQCSDISWVLKLETDVLTSLTINAMTRIQQSNVVQTMIKKYKDLLIFRSKW